MIKQFTLAALALGLTLALALSSEGRIRFRQLQGQGGAGQATAVPAGDAQTVTITFGGVQRDYLVHVPAGGLPASPGAVLVFHGGNGSAARIMGTSGMNQAADQGGFLAVYPDGIGGKWNDEGTGGTDDVGFARAVIAAIEKSYGVNPGKVFVTGVSNGGGFIYRLACEAPDLVAGFAPISANMLQSLHGTCAPGRGIPMVMFSGTADPLQPYKGGTSRQGNVVISAPDSAQFWATNNGCGAATSTELPDIAVDDTTVTKIAYSGCKGGAVVLYRINGGGHAWPGSAVERRVTGNTSQDINATQLLTQFFKSNGL